MPNLPCTPTGTTAKMRLVRVEGGTGMLAAEVLGAAGGVLPMVPREADSGRTASASDSVDR